MKAAHCIVPMMLLLTSTDNHLMVQFFTISAMLYLNDVPQALTL